MKVCSLASSSKGNCTLVYNEDSIILIDMGITLKDLETKLEVLGLDPYNIKAVLISHEHIDHTKGVGTLNRKYGTPIHSHEGAVDGVLSRVGKHNGNVVVFTNNAFDIDNFTIETFRVPHDVPYCVGFSIYENGNKVSIVTDLGHITTDIVEKLYDSRLVILESNHDEQRLMSNPKYSLALKKRILGNNGHLSNRTSAKVLCTLAQHNVKQVLLAHLSEENNTPELCYKTVTEVLYQNGVVPQENIKIDIARPNGLGKIFVVK